MIKRGFRSDINDKLDIIEKICKQMNLEFNNEYANHYKVIDEERVYEFTTYNDVINALKLLKEVKEWK